MTVIVGFLSYEANIALNQTGVVKDAIVVILSITTAPVLKEIIFRGYMFILFYTAFELIASRLDYQKKWFSVRAFVSLF